MRSGSASRSMATIFPPLMVKPNTTRGSPRWAQTSPAALHTPRPPGQKYPTSPRREPRPTPRPARPRHRPAAPPPGRARHQRAEVTAARGGQEGVDHLPLPGQIGVGGRGRSLHAAAGAAGQLACRARGTPDDGPDLVEGQVEHVVQHERDPLGGGQRLQDHQQREADRIGEQHLLLGARRFLAAHGRLGHVHAHRLLAPRLPRAQHVQAYPGGDRRQPSAQVLHAAGARAAEPDPGFLDARPLRPGSRASGRPPPADGCGAPQTAPPSSRVRPSVTFPRRVPSLP